jgi:hypothetical protein
MRCATCMEALTPLVFIEGLAKPLALSADDMQTLLRMTDIKPWNWRVVTIRVS